MNSMKQIFANHMHRLLGATALFSALLFAPLAQADNVGMPVNATYTQECGACHGVYAPGLLPAASWQRVMDGLHKHYGTDASLEDKDRKEISAYLKSNAGTYRRVSEEPPQDRITKSAWFLRKHREGEVPANVWSRPSVGSPANCVACHAAASKGNFSERDVRIPK